MDEIEIGGDIYISSKRAAELTGYAKDYIGQLARSNKIKATRVGRAWYVSKNAIHEHADLPLPEKEQQSNTDEDAIKETTPEVTKERIEKLSHEKIEQPKKPELRTLNELKGSTQSRPSLLQTWSKIQYLDDDRPLFPQNVKAEDTTSSKISIRKLNTQTSDIRDSSKAIFNTVGSSKENLRKDVTKSLRKTKPVRQHIKQSNQRKAPLLLEAVALSVFTIGIFSLSLLGGLYVPSEWSFDTQSFVANSVDIGLGFDLILEYFASIFASGIVLIGDFLRILFNTLEDFFAIGLNFILTLLNLG